VIILVEVDKCEDVQWNLSWSSGGETTTLPKATQGRDCPPTPLPPPGPRTPSIHRISPPPLFLYLKVFYSVLLDR